jgi:hypothetical protein
MRGLPREKGDLAFLPRNGVVRKELETVLTRCLASVGVEGEAAEELLAACRPATITPYDVLARDAEEWVRRVRAKVTPRP